MSFQSLFCFSEKFIYLFFFMSENTIRIKLKFDLKNKRLFKYYDFLNVLKTYKIRKGIKYSIKKISEKKCSC